MKFMLMAGSLRKESVNKKLIHLAHQQCRVLKIDAEMKAFNDYSMPIYDGDIEDTKGLPEAALQLIHDMSEFDGLVFSVPEYNFSMAGSFKNAFDWVSRAKPMPWKGKKVLLLSASPALPGGVRGLWQLRVPFEGCGSFVFPDMFCLGNAYNAFDPQGHLIDKGLEGRLQTTLQQFVDFVERLSPLMRHS